MSSINYIKSFSVLACASLMFFDTGSQTRNTWLVLETVYKGSPLLCKRRRNNISFLIESAPLLPGSLAEPFLLNQSICAVKWI